MEQTCRIALLLDRGLSFVRGVIRGVRLYAANQPNWTLRDGPPQLRLVSQVRDWQPHGIIAGLVLPRVAEELTRLRIPLIDTAFMLPDLGVPVVDVDHAAVGRLAAEYFLEQGFVQFAYFGSESAAYSKAQESAFCERVSRAGHGVSCCHTEYLADVATAALWKKSSQKAQRWLRWLAKPVAIFCCEDAPARYLADVCNELGLKVPEEVALLGVGNDDLDCTLTQPALSSISVPTERIGFEAASLLERLMSGERAPSGPLLLPPLHVISRRSTDVTAVEDEVVRAALRHIREHSRESLSVDDVARGIAAGRRLLERRFRELLGRSVLAEINRVRVEEAKELLAGTHLSIAAVAERCGFATTRRLDVVFARHTGLSPRGYRHQSRPR
ncbi:MAG: XylR family transcriptional regulator [Thermoguttaceae bacterium]